MMEVHIILEHYGYYFEKTGLTFKDTNAEFTEGAHSTVRKFEETHNFKIVRKLGTPIHLRKSLDSITQFNSRNLGASTPERFLKTPLQSTPSFTISFSVKF